MCSLARAQLLDLHQNDLLEFFQSNGFEMHDWMMKPSSVEDIMDSSHKVCVVQRCSLSYTLHSCAQSIDLLPACAARALHP